MRLINLYILLFVFAGITLLSQTTKLDSLFLQLKTENADSSKANIYNKIGKIYWQNKEQRKGISILNNKAIPFSKKSGHGAGLGLSYSVLGNIYKDLMSPDSALYYYGESLKQRKQLNDKSGMAACYYNMATVYRNKTQLDKAIEYDSLAYVLRCETKDSVWMGYSLNNLALSYKLSGNFNKAIEKFLLAAQIMEDIKDNRGIATCLSNIGTIYLLQELYDKALEYQVKGLEYAEKTKIPSFAAGFYNDMGVIYRHTKNHPKAEECYHKALASYLETGNIDGLTTTYNNLGTVMFDLQKWQEALTYFNKALDNGIKSGDLIDISTAYLNIGVSNVKLKNIKAAESNIKMAVEIAEKNRIRYLLVSIYDAATGLYTLKGDYKNALQYHIKLSKAKDSLLNEQKLKQISELQLQFETSKKEKELLRKDAEIIRQTAENKQRKTERNGFIAGFSLMVILVFFVFRSLRLKRQANIEITLQKRIIEEKQKEILDSIRYAKKIQQSLMPTEKYIAKKVSELLKK